MAAHAGDRARWIRVLAALLALSLLAAACGGGGDDDEADPGGGDGGEDAGADAAVDEDGVLHLPATLTAATTTVTYDLVKMQSPANDIHQLVFDTLMRAQTDGTYEPGIATGAEVTDPTTIEVTIREGVKFNDGSPLTPEDVRFSILRNRDSQNGGAFAADMQEISDITVDGQVVTIKLKTPIAGIFFQYLGRGETMVHSKAAVESGADQTEAPVAAGPYMIESLEVENGLVLVKNPHHFEADQVRIPRVEYTHVAPSDPQAVVNGLRAGTFDAAPTGGTVLTAEQVEAVSGGLDTQTEVSPSTLLWGQICKKDEPLSDVRVRQALNFALDRDALNEVIYNGDSEPMWGFWPSGHAFHNPELDGYYERDVEKAKDLLADAGYADGFALKASTLGAITETASEMVQQQWGEIGVELEIVPSTNIVEDFFTGNKTQMYFFPLQRGGLDKVTRNLVPGSIGNVCNWDDPELNALVAQLREVPQSGDSEEAVELWHELEELAVSEAMNIFGVFGTTSNVWDESRLGDVEFVPNFQGVPYLDVRDAFIKA